MPRRRSPPNPRKRVRSLHSTEYRRFVAMLVAKRKDAGLSQQEVADGVALPQSLIAKIERLERRVDVIELIRIAAVVGFDPARLVRDVRAEMIEHGEIEDR